MNEDEEDLGYYREGGYHPVNIGDTFSDGRYTVIRKLGWGHLATVWLAKDERSNRHVALKIVQSGTPYTDRALDGIELFQHLITLATPPVATSSPARTHPGRSHVISFLDHFRHEGPHGTHVCMIFEALGENLLSFIKRYQRNGVPQHLVRQIAKQILLGLDYMHSCGVIHANIKPRNILICMDDVEAVIQKELATASADGAPPQPPTEPVGVCRPRTPSPPYVVESSMPLRPKSEAVDRITVKIADFCSATWVDNHSTDVIQTRQYRCPEALLGAKWGPTADIWSVACVLFELLVGGDYLFDPEAGARYSKDEDHIAQIIELVGEFPQFIAFSGKYSSHFFNDKGELRHINKLRFWTLEDVLHDKYEFPRETAQKIASFLSPMLDLNPEKRARAGELARHRWLSEEEEAAELTLIISTG